MDRQWLVRLASAGRLFHHLNVNSETGAVETAHRWHAPVPSECMLGGQNRHDPFTGCMPGLQGGQALDSDGAGNRADLGRSSRHSFGSVHLYSTRLWKIEMNTLAYHYHIIIILTTNLAACVCLCVCAQNFTNFCPTLLFRLQTSQIFFPHSKIPIRCLWTAFCVPLFFIFYEKQWFITQIVTLSP